MPVVICLLRGVNVGGHNKVKMEALRALYESLQLRDVQTYIQSGNIVFRTKERDLAKLAVRLEDAFEKAFQFRSAVVLRTCAELRETIARNPFAARIGLDPSRILVDFCAGDPGAEARDRVLAIQSEEELRMHGRELYIYFPEGMARTKLWPAVIDRTLKTPATGRNWNTVLKLLEMAEALEAAG